MMEDTFFVERIKNKKRLLIPPPLSDVTSESSPFPLLATSIAAAALSAHVPHAAAAD